MPHHSPTELTAQQRVAALVAYSTHRASRLTCRAAASLAGISVPTAWRYGRRYDSGGLAALTTRRPGKGSPLYRLRLRKETLALMQEHRVSRRCLNAKQAIKRTIEDRRCPREDARKLLPFVVKGRRLPAAFESFLTVRKTVRIELRCGEAFRSYIKRR